MLCFYYSQSEGINSLITIIKRNNYVLYHPLIKVSDGQEQGVKIRRERKRNDWKICASVFIDGNRALFAEATRSSANGRNVLQNRIDNKLHAICDRHTHDQHMEIKKPTRN